MSLHVDATIEARSDDDAVTYAPMTIVGLDLGGTRYDRATVTIANAGSFTWKPQDVLTTMYGYIVKSNQSVTISGLKYRLLVAGNNADFGGAPSSIVITNNSGATATVELLAWGA